MVNCSIMAELETPVTRAKIGNYETWVSIEKNPVEHYKIDVNEDTKTATCWVASQEGKVWPLSCVRSAFSPDLFLPRLSRFKQGKRMNYSTVSLKYISTDIVFLVHSSLEISCYLLLEATYRLANTQRGRSHLRL